jgi:hypothetical protein
VSRRSWETVITGTSLCLCLAGGLSSCAEDEEQPGRVTVSGAFNACRAGECATLPAWGATVELVRLSDQETRVLHLERDGTVTEELPAGTYEVRMAYPELGIDPWTSPTTLEMRDGIQRDVVHVFDERLDVRG